MTSLDIQQIKSAKDSISEFVLETPVWNWDKRLINNILGAETNVHLKLELFQKTGTFKPRGALVNIINLTDTQKEIGVVAVSTGNHAMGVSYAASVLGVSAKIFMPNYAPKVRIDFCEEMGAEVVIVDTLQDAYEQSEIIIEKDGRTLVHQYEGEKTVLGTAGLGLEWANQIREPDAIIIPVGGGGLFAGISTSFKHIYPDCKLYAVEPSESDVISKSLTSGKLNELEESNTIADSLAVLKAEPYTTAICKENIDEIVTVSDSEIKQAMALLFHSMKLAVEPAGAVATAGLIGPLKHKILGKNVGVLVCGSNIDTDKFSRYLEGL